MPVAPLPHSDLNRRCDPSSLDFETTTDLEVLSVLPGQERAVEAIEFALGVEHEGYNLYVLGEVGSGRHALAMRLVEQAAAEGDPADDWLYIHDFEHPDRPRALRLPAGRGRALRSAVDAAVDELEPTLRAAFASDEYRSRRQGLTRELQTRQQEALAGLREQAAARGIALLTEGDSISLVPAPGGEPLGREAIQALPEQERTRLERDMKTLHDELESILSHAPGWIEEQRRRVRELDREVAETAASRLLYGLRLRWQEHPQVLSWLDAVQRDIVEHAQRFQEDGPGLLAIFGREDAHDEWLRRYRVNLLVDRADDTGAPVVYEDHPTLPALVGQVQHRAQLGTLVADFLGIQPGALHRANGGYLVLDARRVLSEPLAWRQLQRTLRSRAIKVESLGEALSLVSTRGLRPEPIPLDCKVVLVGERELYYLLGALDPEFPLLFKVPADLEDTFDRDPEHEVLLARLIATLAHRHGLRPFTRRAVARVIDHTARLAGDASRLSAHVDSLTDLLVEADHRAEQGGRAQVDTEDVEGALADARRRSWRVHDRSHEAIERDLVHIETEGTAVGQANGLMVVALGPVPFGRPGRITARVRLGSGRVLDIEREVELGGPVHSKGVLILGGWLGARYLPDHPLALSATLVMEQSHGPIEGDSASLAETCALLSALGGIPLRQDIGITGAIDQHGSVRAVGGVNEKIEGFFEVCRRRGLTGSQGVIVPAATLDFLMLDDEVVHAAADGQFSVWAVSTIDEAMEILTGLAAGERDDEGAFPPDSVHGRVEARLARFAEQARQSGGDGD